MSPARAVFTLHLDSNLRMTMRKKANKFYLWYVIISVVLVIVSIAIESQPFKMEKDFTHDLRIDLPEYTIEDIEVSDVSEENGELIHMVKSYSIRLNDNIRGKALEILNNQKRGWEADWQGGYHLHRERAVNHMFASIYPASKTLNVTYNYGYLFSGVPVYSIVMMMVLWSLLFIICLILEITLAIRKRNL